MRSHRLNSWLGDGGRKWEKEGRSGLSRRGRQDAWTVRPERFDHFPLQPSRNSHSGLPGGQERQTMGDAAVSQRGCRISAEGDPSAGCPLGRNRSRRADRWATVGSPRSFSRDGAVPAPARNEAIVLWIPKWHVETWSFSSWEIRSTRTRNTDTTLDAPISQPLANNLSGGFGNLRQDRRLHLCLRWKQLSKKQLASPSSILILKRTPCPIPPAHR